LQENALVLHDNASPHTAAGTDETLQEMIAGVLDQPAWNPDRATLDFDLFGLQDRIAGEEVK
jgi:hypothetical protein